MRRLTDTAEDQFADVSDDEAALENLSKQLALVQKRPEVGISNSSDMFVDLIRQSIPKTSPQLRHTDAITTQSRPLTLALLT